MGQIFCVTVAGPLWDPGFADSVTPAATPGSTYRGYRNGYRALHWSRGHRYPGMETPPSGSMSRGAGSLRSHPWTHVLPVMEVTHTLVQQELVSPPPSPGGVPGRGWAPLQPHEVIYTKVAEPCCAGGPGWSFERQLILPRKGC